MAVSDVNGKRSYGIVERIRITLDMIKFEHTVFALPFALISMLLAAHYAHMPHGLPPAPVIGWILVAMVGARSAAMAFNRIADARYDAENPRTASRAIPKGLLTVRQVAVFTVCSLALFELAAYSLNPLCFALSPLAVVALLGYSYTKRFTALAHFALGIATGIAPVGAWLAVTGAFHAAPIMLGVVVMLWIGGFDVIYALQDLDYDRRVGLFSLPSRVGPVRALWISRLMHVGAIALLLAIGAVLHLHLLYLIGVGVAACLIAYEHSLVSPTDLSRLNVAFFTMNGWVSMSLLAFVIAERVVNP